MFIEYWIQRASSNVWFPVILVLDYSYKSMLFPTPLFSTHFSRLSLSDSKKCMRNIASMQILTDELVKEVENSIAEFKHHNQDYDEDRIKAQVTLPYWVQILML